MSDLTAKQGEHRGCDTRVNTPARYEADAQGPAYFPLPHPSSLLRFQLVSKAISSLVE